MTGENALYNVAEVAIGLAGFSGLVAVFRSNHLGAWLPRERFMFWLLLAAALGALFFALLPITIHHFGLADRTVWATSCSLLGSYLVGVIAASFVVSARMNRAADPTSRPGAWYILPPVGAVVALLLFLNAAGIIFDRSVGPYHAGLLFLLASGSTLFVFLLVFTPGGPRA